MQAGFVWVGVVVRVGVWWFVQQWCSGGVQEVGVSGRCGFKLSVVWLAEGREWESSAERV